jgi:hypothetical protein
MNLMSSIILNQISSERINFEEEVKDRVKEFESRILKILTESPTPLLVEEIRYQLDTEETGAFIGKIAAELLRRNVLERRMGQAHYEYTIPGRLRHSAYIEEEIISALQGLPKGLPFHNLLRKLNCALPNNIHKIMKKMLKNKRLIKIGDNYQCP